MVLVKMKKTAEADMKHWPFKVVDEEGMPRLRVEYKGENKTFTPEELQERRKVAEAACGPCITRLYQESAETTMPDMDGLNMGGPTFSVGGGGKKKKGKGKKH